MALNNGKAMSLIIDLQQQYEGFVFSSVQTGCAAHPAFSAVNTERSFCVVRVILAYLA